MTDKVCRRCKVSKDVSKFAKALIVKSGLRAQCRECLNETNKKLYYEKYAIVKRKIDPDITRARVSSYKKHNPEYARECDSRRRAALRNQAPKWANSFFIKEAYELSTLRTKVTGFKWEVDHIVPIKCKTASGLHVEYNLAVIPAVMNNRKLNNLIVIKPY